MAKSEKLQTMLVSELLESLSPEDWKDWLNEIQAHLISSGYCEAMSSEGATDFAANFLNLHHFFSGLRDLQKQ